MTIIDQIATKIIQGQELIIGPIAWQEARKVPGLNIVNQFPGEISISGEDTTVVDRLVSKYEHLFGRASREVCKESVSSLIADLPPSVIPSSLR